MVPVVFSPQRLDALKLFGDVSPLTDPYLMGIVSDVATTLINSQIDIDNPRFPLMDYLQTYTSFATRIDEHLADLWFNSGRYDYTAKDLSDVHMLVLSAGRLLSMDIRHLMSNVLNYQCKIKNLTIKGNVGELCLV